MIPLEILDRLGSIISSTILTPSRIAFCGPSKAIIYDDHEKKIVAEYLSKEKLQIAFYRTSDPNIILCCNSNLEIESSEEKKLTANKETSIKTNNVLLNPSTLKIGEESFDGLADNVICINEKKIYIEKPFKGRNGGSSTREKFDLNVYITQTTRQDFFHIFFDTTAYHDGHWIAMPPFKVGYWPSTTDFWQYTSFEGFLMSACCMDGLLILGCQTAKRSDGFSRSPQKPFKLGFWDLCTTKKIKWCYSIELDHILEKLVYIPEKEIMIGLVKDTNKNLLYIFNKQLEYQIITMPQKIVDIAVFANGHNKILFENGKMLDLEKYINPGYYNKYLGAIDHTKIPTDVLAIIKDYSFDSNRFSIFYPKETFLEQAINFIKLNC